MKDELVEALKKAFTKLIKEDGCLFDCPIEYNFNYNPRKLHEVCINHKLANYLQEFILPFLEYRNRKYFVDIEFNREGGNKKEIMKAGKKEVVRPDIIIHNRKTCGKKDNFLIVECKKADVSNRGSEDDIDKIKSFIKDKKYKYQFGLQVTYGRNKIRGTLFYPTEQGILSEEVNYR